MWMKCKQRVCVLSTLVNAKHRLPHLAITLMLERGGAFFLSGIDVATQSMAAGSYGAFSGGILR